jgi:mevalonate kinase
MSYRPALDFKARATLPVGAGLGSSASFSTCAASALLLLYGRITPPSPSENENDHVHISQQGRRAISASVAEEVNKWAFVAEKILHGNPSGVDNSVAVFGGALAYTRAGFGRKSGMEPIQGLESLLSLPRAQLIDYQFFTRFKSLRFLLTNSKVPRDTKKLVADVAELKARVSYGL